MIDNEVVGELITLQEWTEKNRRSLASVRRYLLGKNGFPDPEDYRARAGGGSGPAEPLYDEDALDAFARRYDAEHRPAAYPMPDGAEEFRTLGAIAKLLGVDGKTVTQYRDQIEQKAVFQETGKQRRYRTADVIEVLNARRGSGRAQDPATDQRRRRQI